VRKVEKVKEREKGKRGGRGRGEERREENDMNTNYTLRRSDRMRLRKFSNHFFSFPFGRKQTSPNSLYFRSS
jgi:hypothetical protein